MALNVSPNNAVPPDAIFASRRPLAGPTLYQMKGGMERPQLFLYQQRAVVCRLLRRLQRKIFG